MKGWVQQQFDFFRLGFLWMIFLTASVIVCTAAELLNLGGSGPSVWTIIGVMAVAPLFPIGVREGCIGCFPKVTFGWSHPDSEHDDLVDRTVLLEEALTRCFAVMVQNDEKERCVVKSVADALVAYCNVNGVFAKDVHPIYRRELENIVKRCSPSVAVTMAVAALAVDDMRAKTSK